MMVEVVVAVLIQAEIERYNLLPDPKKVSSSNNFMVYLCLIKRVKCTRLEIILKDIKFLVKLRLVIQQ